MKTCEPSRQISLFETESDGSMSSRVDSRARTLALRGKERAWAKEQGLDFGQKSPDWLANYDLDTSSWKTSQTCLVDHQSNQADGLAEFSETWPRSGMMRSGIAYRLHTLAQNINETGSGFWPTPNLSERPNRDIQYRLAMKKQIHLSEAVRIAEKKNGRLNPNWIDWLMGYPTGHTELSPSETPSSRKSQS